MLTRTIPALLLVGLSALACVATTTSDTSTGPQADPKPNVVASPEVEPTDPDDDDDDETVGRNEALPDCPAEPGSLPHYCNDAGKLVGQWRPVDTLEVPDDVTIVFDATGPDATRQTSLMIAIRGDELYIRHVTCGQCRRVLGQGFAGDLGQLSEVQLRALQTQLGLAADTPLLTGTAQWSEFCASEAGKAALTEIAGRSDGDPDGRGR